MIDGKVWQVERETERGGTEEAPTTKKKKGGRGEREEITINGEEECTVQQEGKETGL